MKRQTKKMRVYVERDNIPLIHQLNEELGHMTAAQTVNFIIKQYSKYLLLGDTQNDSNNGQPTITR